MTMGGRHGCEMIQSIGVGASMVPRSQVIHHQQRCRAQQRVIPTIIDCLDLENFIQESYIHVYLLRGGGVKAA